MFDANDPMASTRKSRWASAARAVPDRRWEMEAVASLMGRGRGSRLTGGSSSYDLAMDDALRPTAGGTSGGLVPSPAACDTSTQCGWCGGAMRPEHAHYRCRACGQRDSCCDGPY